LAGGKRFRQLKQMVTWDVAVDDKNNPVYN
jgi:hypothetical protein